MKVTIEKEIIVTKMNDELAILNIKSGQYFNLNAVATRIWNLLCEHEEIDLVFKMILDEYDVEESLLKKDFDHILNHLNRTQLVTWA